MMQRATFAIPGDIDTITGGYIYEKQLLLALRRAGWEVTHLALPGGFPNPTKATIAAVADALAALPPAVPVILDGFLPGAMPPDRLARLRAPFVAITHHPLAYESGLDPARAAVLRGVERANLARAAHVIVPSPHTARMLVSDFGVAPARLTVATPGVTRPAAQATPARSTPEILSVGQLVPRKGHDTLIRALARLTDLPWHATIAGRPSDPDHARALERLVAQHALAARVRFAGPLSAEDLAAEYARAHVFALATQYEGYGMVFAEAMVHGLPIVTCDGGAVPDTVPETAGLLAPVGDVTAFAAALRRVLSDDALHAALSAGAVAAGRALPSWDDTARLVAPVLARLAAQT